MTGQPLGNEKHRGRWWTHYVNADVEWYELCDDNDQELFDLLEEEQKIERRTRHRRDES